LTCDPYRFGECEAAKIAPLIVPYVQGRCLDIGSGPGKVWPSLIGIDLMTQGGRPVTDMAIDGTVLPFGDATMDGVFSSFLLQQMEPSKVPDVLREWARVIKPGGHMVLYVPSAALAPHVGSDGAYPGQRWNIAAGELERLLKSETRCGWELAESEERDQGDEFGLLVVVKKTVEGWTEKVWQRNPDGKKRSLVVRYGAIGDAIVTASIFPGLKAQGYHVTVNCRPSTYDVLREDPFVDEWLIQENDFVPNEMLGQYWSGMNERYDRVINLSESIEGWLLALPGRLNHAYPYGTRERLYGGVNYLEHTHNIADVPFDFSNARFHPTEDEAKWARAVRRHMGGSVVVWCVNGSSPHKVYPFVQVVSAWLLERTTAHIVLYGDPGVGKQLQDAIMDCLRRDGADMARVVGVADKWKIRQSLAFAQVADCVVGPETGPMNAVAMEDVPKVIYLSHSSAANLTKHWRNTTTLLPANVACYPCHRLHSTWQHCNQDEATRAALCASSIRPETVFEAIGRAIIQRAAA
jgi:ADP-heptose:LPS heptosyltransferase